MDLQWFSGHSQQKKGNSSIQWRWSVKAFYPFQKLKKIVWNWPPMVAKFAHASDFTSLRSRILSSKMKLISLIPQCSCGNWCCKFNIETLLCSVSGWGYSAMLLLLSLVVLGTRKVLKLHIYLCQDLHRLCGFEPWLCYLFSGTSQVLCKCLF